MPCNSVIAIWTIMRFNQDLTEHKTITGLQTRTQLLQGILDWYNTVMITQGNEKDGHVPIMR